MTTEFKKIKYKLFSDPIALGKTLKFKGINTSFDVEEFKPKRLTVVSPFPAISTKTCDEQTHGLSELANKYKDKIDVVSISMDLPFTLAEWCGANGVDNVNTLSDYRFHDFGKNSGFLINDIMLLNRGIIVVDKDSKVLYVEALENVHNQINFAKVDEFIAKL
ncbi:thiol peroxidase, atypical 2-Cys peroxiredoxin [Mycoplasma testudineum]|uniref:Thiol peroxidase, atypical 2-Cys peroxiredoxin n=1 Tax=Mycoplasma testudineum TaxID=244584 RepID=A0A4R6I9Y5_9MOLU|nr:peroxiredoxin [Mycoplasma testudineum]OYD26502.1 thiol peroxidase [Mycoplasma testudineum]TDO18990.1 thiol peroxidase, atypical 2-Cys peroxiredoxin [Mycoplasma testudineum]